MEIEWMILNKILEMREKTRCTKFVGALTIELLRKELAKNGFNVSNRDVFIEGVPNEKFFYKYKNSLGSWYLEPVNSVPNDLIELIDKLLINKLIYL